ncbi:hypothetical protein J9303_18825 [Bacillaceae bacterium Marseille-Q3522]|nr:hypothetical protein [Bacillaceae bacterium Marseille-Q3522]
MNNNYQTRHIFLAFSICVAILSPICLLFVPQLVAEIVHYSSDMWHVFVPSENFIVYGAGFLLIFLAVLLPFLFNIKKISFILSIVCLLLSVIPFYVASQSYKSISEDSISFSSLFSNKAYSYDWNQIKAIIYYESDDSDYSEYEFLFHDGNSMTIQENQYFNDIRLRFDHKLNEQEIKLEKVKKF